MAISNISAAYSFAFLVLFCVCSLFLVGVDAAGSERSERSTPNVLRGIAPGDRQRYKSAVTGKTFTCFDGKQTVAASALNDDYCDCEDGSDEPGTSACENGKFYCANVYYKAKTISSMFVDDGVCDCCDGSDELIGCKNTCKEEGAELRVSLENDIRNAKEGLKLKASLLAGNVIDEDETERQVAIMEKKINATSILVEKLEAKVREQNEALLAEHEAKMAAEKDKEKKEEGADYDEEEEEEEDTEDEEYEEMMQEGDGSGGEKEETDEEVGRKIASRWTRDPDAAKSEEGDTSGGAEEGGEEEEGDAGSGEGDKPEEKGAEEEFDYGTFEKEAETIEADADNGHTEGSFLSIFKKGLDIVKKVFEKSEQEKVQEELNKQTKELSKMKDELKKMKELLSLDFGKDNKFLKYHGQCFSKVIEKYTYKICPFDSAKQDHTNLGSYQGLGDDEKSFLFGEGTGCWNGPKRSIKVNLSCGVKEEILKVEEPSVCEYVALFSTPLVCEETVLERILSEYQKLTGETLIHDEL